MPKEDASVNATLQYYVKNFLQTKLQCLWVIFNFNRHGHNNNSGKLKLAVGINCLHSKDRSQLKDLPQTNATFSCDNFYYYYIIIIIIMGASEV